MIGKSLGHCQIEGRLGAGPDPRGITRKIIHRIYGETGIPFGWLGY
jgi:hypothetical protein